MVINISGNHSHVISWVQNRDPTTGSFYYVFYHLYYDNVKINGSRIWIFFFEMIYFFVSKFYHELPHLKHCFIPLVLKYCNVHFVNYSFIQVYWNMNKTIFLTKNLTVLLKSHSVGSWKCKVINITWGQIWNLIKWLYTSICKS